MKTKFKVQHILDLAKAMLPFNKDRRTNHDGTGPNEYELERDVERRTRESVLTTGQRAIAIQLQDMKYTARILSGATAIDGGNDTVVNSDGDTVLFHQYAHVSNGGVVFEVLDSAFGPQVTMSMDSFGAMTSKLTVLLDQKSLRALGEGIVKASEAPFGKPYSSGASSTDAVLWDGTNLLKGTKSRNELAMEKFKSMTTASDEE